jgi:outer membrane protein assembly factor BamA
MLPMRSPLAQLAAACILACQTLVHSQDASLTLTASAQGENPCPAFSNSDVEPSTPQIQVADVTFSGSPQLPTSEQEQIAESIKERSYGNSVDKIVDTALEIARERWQDRGYFRAQVSGDAKTLTSNAVGQRIAINMQVDEGPQFVFGQITFKHNKAISDIAFLQGLFPMQRGELFSREKMTRGLENLKKAYDKLGYINFTPVPTPSFDDQNHLLSFEIDIDEGKQFRFRNVRVLGVEENSTQELLKDFPSGRIYSERAFKKFLEKHSFKFPSSDPRRTERYLDERRGTVSITLDARPCTVE